MKFALLNDCDICDMQRFGQRFGLFVLEVTIFFVRTPLISEKF